MDIGLFLIVAVLGYVAGMIGSFLAALYNLCTLKPADGGFLKMIILAGSAQWVKTVQIPKIVIAAVAAAVTLSIYSTPLEAIAVTAGICSIVAFFTLVWLFSSKGR